MSEPPAERGPQGTAPAVRRLAWQSGVYALGNLVLKGAGLLLLPLYLDPARLPVADYGYLGLIETAAQLAIAVTGLGLASGLLRYATAGGQGDPKSYAATAFWTTLALAGLLVALVWIAAPLLASVLAGDASRSAVVRWAGLYAALKTVGAVPYMVLRVRERAGVYLLALVLEVAVLVGGVALALGRFEAGLEGVVMAFAASGAVAAALSLGLLGTVRRGWQPRLASQLVRFGWPLAGAALAGILLNTGDRFVLEALAGPEVLAVYVLAAKFGGLINMLFVQSFNLAFSVLGLKALGAGEGTDLHRRVFRHYTVLTGWGVLGVSLLAYDVTRWLSPDPGYLAADPLILPVALGFLFYGLYYLFLNVLYSADRTRRVAVLVLASAGANVALNIALVPWLGAMGAALATAASYALLAGWTLRQARRVEPVAVPWIALVGTLGLVVALWLVAQPTLDWGDGARLAARLGILGLYPPLVLVLRLYRLDEVRALLRLRGGAQR